MTTPPTPDTEPAEIRALSVLPARRTDIELHTADGLTLVGELALPAEREPRATLITLHPLPTHGGFMDSHVFRKAAWRLPALADLAVLRFNTRRRCTGRRLTTWRPGTSSASPWWCLSPSSTSSCVPMRRASGSRPFGRPR